MVIRRGGRAYTYLRRRGQPLVRLPDLPHDDPRFLAAYAAAMGTEPTRTGRPHPHSVGALIEAAAMSPRFRALSPSYRAMLRRDWDAIRTTGGAAPVDRLEARHIAADVRSAPDPVKRRKAWRYLLRHALDAGQIDTDPSAAVRVTRPATDGHPPWTADEIAAFRARWPIGTAARLCMEVLHWTGARVSDGVAVGPGHVGADGVLAFRQRKTGDWAYVPWSCALPAWAAHLEPDRQHMRSTLDARLTRHMTWLATEAGKPRSAAGLGNLIASAARAAGIEKSAHGLRKARAVALAEAGASVHQISAWTGHQSLAEVQHYTRAAERRRAVIGQDENAEVQTKCKTNDGKQ